MVFCVVNRSCGETRGSSCSRRRKASIFSLGQSERLAKVRWRVFLPSRQPSRRRMAGGELRLGTTAIYMRTLTNINPNLSREIYSYMRTQINENQVAVRAKPHIFKILTSNRASTVGWNFGLSGASQVSVVESPHLRNRKDVALFRLLHRSVLRRVLGFAGPRQISGHRGLRHCNPQLEQFSVNAGCTPQGVGLAHAPN